MDSTLCPHWWSPLVSIWNPLPGTMACSLSPGSNYTGAILGLTLLVSCPTEITVLHRLVRAAVSYIFVCFFSCFKWMNEWILCIVVPCCFYHLTFLHYALSSKLELSFLQIPPWSSVKEYNEDWIKLHVKVVKPELGVYRCWIDSIYLFTNLCFFLFI